MHYLGMAAIQTNGTLHYNPLTVVLSVVIAVGAATAALWAAVSIHARGRASARAWSWVAVTGMHYTGMAAVSVHLTHQAASAQSLGRPGRVPPGHDRRPAHRPADRRRHRHVRPRP
ncbi:MHYT domain-containing protein [Streptomyces sp. L7]